MTQRDPKRYLLRPPVAVREVGGERRELAPQQARRLILSQDAAAMQALWEDLLTLDERATIAGIDRPYLVCSGAQSRVYPASAATWLAQAAPQARHQVFARSGHSPHLEEPAAMSDALCRFIRALPA